MSSSCTLILIRHCNIFEVCEMIITDVNFMKAYILKRMTCSDVLKLACNCNSNVTFLISMEISQKEDYN